jgi:hypothetical protein
MAKREFTTFGAKSEFDIGYSLPRDPEEGDTVFVDQGSNGITHNVMLYFAEPDVANKQGDWLTGHLMHMVDGPAGSGVVEYSLVEPDANKNLGLAECQQSSGEDCIGVYQPFSITSIPDEDDVCGVAISGIWNTLFYSGSSVRGYFATVSGSAAGEGDDISSSGTARVGIWTESTGTWSNLWICGMERA